MTVFVFLIAMTIAGRAGQVIPHLYTTTYTETYQWSVINIWTSTRDFGTCRICAKHHFNVYTDISSGVRYRGYLLFDVNTKYISLSALKTSEFS